MRGHEALIIVEMVFPFEIAYSLSHWERAGVRVSNGAINRRLRLRDTPQGHTAATTGFVRCLPHSTRVWK